MVATTCYILLQISLQAFQRGGRLFTVAAPIDSHPMSHARSRMLSDAEVALLEARRKALDLSLPRFRERFDEGLRRDGVNLADNSVRMRLDRVLNPRLRRPATEQTLRALAWALRVVAPGAGSEAGRGGGARRRAEGRRPARGRRRDELTAEDAESAEGDRG